MRRDLLLLDQPPEHRGRTISHVTDQALRFEVEPLLDALDHSPGGVDFGRPPSGRRFDIDNDSGLDINQVIGRSFSREFFNRIGHNRPPGGVD
jgi:hypothetical protein